MPRPTHEPMTEAALEICDDIAAYSKAVDGYPNLIAVRRDMLPALTADLREARRLLRAIERISVLDSQGQPYLTCPLCVADLEERGGHTVWCDLGTYLADCEGKGGEGK